MLQRSADEFVKHQACVSCHHNILPILTLHLARDRGVGIDQAVLDAVEKKTFVDLRNADAFDKAVQASTLNDPTPNDSYLLMAAGAAGIAPDLTTKVYARRLAAWQRDGHWITSDFRPPHSSSEFTATATAIRAMRLYMPEEMNALREQSFAKARQWMLGNRPLSTEDAAFRLMGFVWAAAPQKEIQTAEHDLIAMQQTDGGWAQLRTYESDAYSTGQALYALSEAGIQPSDAVWMRGSEFLISSQAPDGTWHIRSRMLSPATVSPPYFETGFPYKHDQFLSYAGSCWAVMALLRSLPEAGPARVPSTADVLNEWERTALFGTASQLRALLDAGLDANTATKKGTSLLMMSVADAAKVQLLLSRGANAKARSTLGTDALTVAASYRGTTASLRLLLDAGAEPDPPDNVHVRNAPLTLAAMSGDLENVRALLKGGANATPNALSEAVTFGNPEVVQALVRAEADPTITESTGINMLHWATITNRPALIPVLAKMGVPVNDLDHNGFSPLMYAATLDFGETRALRALLKAGADPKLANHDGRNAIQQAEFLKHEEMVSILKGK
jgi:ankyrin repeat protein